MDHKKMITQYLDDHQDELFALLSALIQQDTQNFNHDGLEENGQKVLAEYCRKYGFDPVLYCPDSVPGLTESVGYLPGRGTDHRPNLSVVYGPEKWDKRVTLAAHMDTVPIGDEAAWTESPFSGSIHDGHLYGRGAGDDKSGIAAGLFAMRAIRELNIPIKDQVVLTSYVDEEFGGGNGSLATCMKYPSDAYLNLDARDINCWGVGGIQLLLHINTRFKAEDSRHALEGANRAVQKLKAFGDKLTAELKAHPVYADSHQADTALRFMEVSAGTRGTDMGHGKVEFVFYAIRPQEEIMAELEEIRLRLARELDALELDVSEYEKVSRYFIPYLPEKPGENAVLFQRLFSEQLGKPVEFCGCCLSDLNIYGPFGGGEAFNTGVGYPFHHIGGAHQPNECIPCDKLLGLAKAVALYLAEGVR